jgi:hypothetical protein
VNENVRVYKGELSAIGSAVGVDDLKTKVVKKCVAHVKLTIFGHDSVCGFGVKANAVDVATVDFVHWGSFPLSFDKLIIAQGVEFVNPFFHFF